MEKIREFLKVSYGHGYGDGNGSGINKINGFTVHKIDCLPTVIYSVRGNIAKGAILSDDLTLVPCYVVKENNKFAHGETLAEAMQALSDKL